MNDNARTAQELAELAEAMDTHAQYPLTNWTGKVQEAAAAAAELRRLAALASQAEPAKGRLISSGPNAGRAVPPPAPAPAPAEHSEDGIPSFASRREAIVRAWNDLPESLRCHPGLKALYRALSGAAIAAKEQS